MVGVTQENELELRAVKTPLVSDVHINLTPSPAPSVVPTATPSPTETPKPPTPEPSRTPSYDLKKVNNEKGYVKGHNVNLRSGPGTEYNKLDTAKYHTKLIITGKTEDWYRIEIGDIEGFILKEFVGVGSIPTPTPTPSPTKKAKATPKPEKTAEPTPRPTVEQGEKGDYSEEDVYLVARLIYAEGKNQSTESFLAMANVLYNRCNSKNFGGSVEAEVYRKNQFTVVDNSGFEELQPSSKALSAARDVFNEGVRVLPAKVMYFRAASRGTKWSRRTYYATIGGNAYFS